VRTIERISMYSGQPIPRPGTGRRLSLRANAGPFDLPIRTERDSALQCTLFKFHLVDVSASGTDSLERYGLDPSEVGYVALNDFSYVVILAERSGRNGTYHLAWTAFCLERPHQRTKLEKEWRKRSFVGQHFWARGYFVSTVGRDEDVIRTYIQQQEQEDRRLDQLNLSI